MSYAQGIWRARYFWVHLAKSDLRARWRGTFLGIFWSILQPLGLTALLAVVLSRLFGAEITTFAPYVLSGVIVWEFIGANVTGGSLAFVQADAYIRQTKHPLAIYSLRTVLGSLAVLLLASTSLFAWAAVVLPHNFGWHWFATLTIFPVLAIVAWPLGTLLAYIGARFRDLPHATGLVLQALWFVSPVYFEVRLFRQGGLDGLVDHNPIYHVMQILRAPLLDGTWPTASNYLYPFALAVVCFALAWLVGRKAEPKVIFYL